MDKKQIGLSTKTYCSILTVATILSVPLMALWEVNIFCLDFFVTSMVHMLGLSIAYIPSSNTPVENESLIVIGFAASIVIMFVVSISLFLWKKIYRFLQVFCILLVYLDIIFLICRITIGIPGAKGVFYLTGSFFWKLYGIILSIYRFKK